MKSRSVKLLGLLFAVTASGNPVPPAHANVNISAAACQLFDEAFFKNTADFVVGTGPISNGSETNTLRIVCSVPHSPLVAGATVGQFFVDGLNPAIGTTATCVVYSWDYTATLLGTASFSFTSSPSATTYDGLITMPAQLLPPFAYTTVLCTLPPHGSSFYGVTVWP